MKEDYNKEVSIADLTEYLGTARFTRDIYEGERICRCWSQAWRDLSREARILFIETSLSKAKAGKLTLTGNLGDDERVGRDCAGISEGPCRLPEHSLQLV